MPKGPLQIVVSIGSQKVTLYSNGQRVAQGGVSTGQPGHSTPMGVFSVIEKDRHHHSNIYSGAPMPFMQRITWSGVALHEGVLPGYPASHGCIRMSHDFAQKLWPVTKLGVRVIVARGDVSPVDFEHAKLFTPKPKPDGSSVAAVDAPIRLAQVRTATEEGVTVIDVTPVPMVEGAPPVEPPKPVVTEAPAAPGRDGGEAGRTRAPRPTLAADDVKETGAIELRKAASRAKHQPAERRSLPKRRRLSSCAEACRSAKAVEAPKAAAKSRRSPPRRCLPAPNRPSRSRTSSIRPSRSRRASRPPISRRSATVRWRCS